MSGVRQMVEDSGMSLDEVVAQLQRLIEAGERAERSTANAAAMLRSIANHGRQQ